MADLVLSGTGDATGTVGALHIKTPSGTPYQGDFTASALAVTPPPSGFLFEDNGGGVAGPLDPAKWTYDVGGSSENGQLQNTYTNRVQNSGYDGIGNLYVRALRESFDAGDGIVKPYTSARIKTRGRFHFGPGTYVELRAKAAVGAGCWGGFWAIPESGDWPPEVDGAEVAAGSPEGPTYVHMNLHLGPNSAYDAGWAFSGAPNPSDLGTAFHTYGFYADQTKIDYYFDGTKVRTILKSSVPTQYGWIFDKGDLYLIINLAIGFAGGDPSNTAFPQEWTIDYIRASSGEPTTAVHPPLVTTGAATNVTSSSVKLTGSVDPQGALTYWQFEFGSTTSYGGLFPSTAGQLAAGQGAQSVNVDIASGLSPGTTYHYRLVGSNSAGTVHGTDGVFTTAAAGSGTQTFDDVTALLYSGGWKVANDVVKFGGSEHYADATGRTATLSIQTGANGKVRLYGAKASHHGIMTVKVDATTAVDVDCYAANRLETALLWESQVLASGEHTLVMTSSGRKNPVSTGIVIALDKVQVDDLTVLHPPTSPPPASNGLVDIGIGLTSYEPVTAFSAWSDQACVALGQVATAAEQWTFNWGGAVGEARTYQQNGRWVITDFSSIDYRFDAMRRAGINPAKMVCQLIPPVWCTGADDYDYSSTAYNASINDATHRTWLADYAEDVYTHLHQTFGLTALGFLNELKGYWAGSDWDWTRFMLDFNAIANRVRPLGAKMGGPYLILQPEQGAGGDVSWHSSYTNSTWHIPSSLTDKIVNFIANGNFDDLHVDLSMESSGHDYFSAAIGFCRDALQAAGRGDARIICAEHYGDWGSAGRFTDIVQRYANLGGNIIPFIWADSDPGVSVAPFNSSGQLTAFGNECVTIRGMTNPDIAN